MPLIKAVIGLGKIMISTTLQSPDCSIVKDELFDLDMAYHVISSKAVGMEEKKRIRAMIKARKKGNVFTCYYVLGKRIKDAHMGRWIAKNGIGLQGLSRDIRNALDLVR